MRELKLKNNEVIFEFNQAMEQARVNLHKVIEIYGRDSNEAVIASENLDTYINMSMKENDKNGM
jgi:stringent starvation protein B